MLVPITGKHTEEEKMIKSDTAASVDSQNKLIHAMKESHEYQQLTSERNHFENCSPGIQAN